jgi:hypothetical protein
MFQVSLHDTVEKLCHEVIYICCICEQLDAVGISFHETCLYYISHVSLHDTGYVGEQHGAVIYICCVCEQLDAVGMRLYYISHVSLHDTGYVSEQHDAVIYIFCVCEQLDAVCIMFHENCLHYISHVSLHDTGYVGEQPGAVSIRCDVSLHDTGYNHVSLHDTGYVCEKLLLERQAQRRQLCEKSSTVHGCLVGNDVVHGWPGSRLHVICRIA